MRPLSRSVLALGLVGSLALTACGGDNNDEASAGATSDPATPAGATGSDDGTTVPDNPDEGVPDGEIVLGWMGDLTGPVASVVTPTRDGAQAYIDMVNADGGILGRTVVLEEYDDQFDAEKAVANYQSAVNDAHVLAFLQMAGSHITPALGQDLVADNIPVIGPLQTTDPQMDVPVIFQTLAHYAEMADVDVARAIDLVGGEGSDVKAALFLLDVPSSDEFAGYVEEKLADEGGEVLGEVRVSAASADYRTAAIQMQGLIDEGVNVILGAGSPTNFLGLNVEMVDQGMDVPVLGNQPAASVGMFQELPEERRSEVEGAHSFVSCLSDVPGAEEIRNAVDDTDACSDVAWVMGWVNAKIAHQAIERAAETGELTREGLIEALRGTFDVGGLTCPVDWTDSNYSPCAATLGWTGDGVAPVKPFYEYAETLEIGGTPG